MNVIFVVLSVLFMLMCGALVACILMQEKRAGGLGSVAGMGNAADTYWDKNKGRSREGTLEKWTKIGGVVFFLLSLLLSLIPIWVA